MNVGCLKGASDVTFFCKSKLIHKCSCFLIGQTVIQWLLIVSLIFWFCAVYTGGTRSIAVVQLGRKSNFNSQFSFSTPYYKLCQFCNIISYFQLWCPITKPYVIDLCLSHDPGQIPSFQITSGASMYLTVFNKEVIRKLLCESILFHSAYVLLLGWR